MAKDFPVLLKQDKFQLSHTGVVTRSKKSPNILLSSNEKDLTLAVRKGKGGPSVSNNLPKNTSRRKQTDKELPGNVVPEHHPCRITSVERTSKKRRAAVLGKDKTDVSSPKKVMADNQFVVKEDSLENGARKKRTKAVSDDKNTKKQGKHLADEVPSIENVVDSIVKHKGPGSRRSGRINNVKLPFKEIKKCDDNDFNLDKHKPHKKASVSSARPTRSVQKTAIKDEKPSEKKVKSSSRRRASRKIDSDSDEFKLEEDSDPDSDEAGSDWEDVTSESEPPAKKKKNFQPIQVTVSGKSGSKKSKLEQAMDEIRRRINRKLIISQYNVHKVHLLCLISLGRRVSSVGSNNLLMGSLLSRVPLKLLNKMEKKSFDSECLIEVKEWFLKEFPIQLQADCNGIIRLKSLADVVMLRKKLPLSEIECILMFVCLCRSLGLNARIVFSLQPTAYKATDTLPSRPLSKAFLDKIYPKSQGEGKVDTNTKRDFKESNNLSESSKSNEKRKEAKNKGKKRTQTEKKSRYSDEVDETDGGDDDDDDEEEEEEEEGKKNEKKRKAKTGGKKKIVDQGNSTAKKKQNGRSKDVCNWWAEVYMKSTSLWIAVAGPTLDIKNPDEVEKRVSKPISYILAFDAGDHVKDLTRKYDGNWLKTTSKSRLDEGWWCNLLRNFSDDASDESLEEDLLIHDALLKKPFPTSVSEYKNHPLYALQRHLLRYEAIYPPTSAVLGRLKNDEPIFARECVHTLCSREKWLIEGRMILPDQEPYKFVKALPKPGKQKIEMDQMLGLYGSWQTELYIGPQAVDGIVPKNKYGNVDLFKPWMLPQGTVHLKGTYYGMGKAARKAGIDAAPAMTGWEFHKGLNHPILDGWVVCKENVDALLDSWRNEQKLEKEKEKEKRERRALGNWKRLMKNLQIRNKLKRRAMSIDEAKAKMQTAWASRVENLDSDSESRSSFLTVSELSEPTSKRSGGGKKDSTYELTSS